MRRLLLAWLPFAALCLFPSAPRARAEDQPPPLTNLSVKEVEDALGIDWYGVYMVGKKAGFARFSLAQGTDPKRAGFVANLQITLPLVVAGAKQEMRLVQTLEFAGEPPFSLQRATAGQTGRNDDRVTQLIRKENGFEAVRTAAGTTTRKQLGPLDYTLADVVTPVVWVRREPKLGDRVTSRIIDFDKLQLEPEIRKLLSTKTSVAEGVRVNYREVQVTLPRHEVSALERYDEKGRLLSGKLAGVIELRAEIEARAKSLEYSTDLFLLGTVTIDRPLGDAARVSGLVLEVSGKEAADIKSGPRQSVTPNESGTFTFQLGRAHGTPLKATDKDVEENLAATDDYPLSDSKVRDLVKQALKEAQTPREKVDRLVHFVANYLTPDFQTRPRSVAQLLTVRKGACTEYARLFTTLARAAGIPARDVVGFVYMGDDQRAFGPHAWNEVVLDGVWTPVDASWNETEVNATHIRCGPSRPDQVSWLASFLSTFGKLSFRVVEVRRRP
jgi:hypothetical protein